MKAVLIALALLAGLLAAWPLTVAQGSVSAVVQGPSAVAPGTIHLYKITVTGGPAESGGTFQIEYTLQGEKLVGGDPQIPRTLANAEGRFAVNITAPEVEGSVVLHVKATSRGETNETTEVRFGIDVFRPVEIRATLRNRGAAAAVNVKVFFYVDGQLVGNQTVSRIEAGGQVEVNVSYIPVDLQIGRHTIRIEADLDGDGKISPNSGELLVHDLFYKTERTSTPAILGTITVVILVLLGFILLAIRRQRRLG